jgi:hypothetical protein
MAKDKTLSFFEQRRPDAVEHLLPIVPSNPGQHRIDELVWTREERAVSWDSFSRDRICSTPSDAVFFIDTSFLYRREIPQVVFDALLSRTVVITPLIWDELQDWLANPFANRRFRDVLSDARTAGSPSVIFLESNSWCEDICQSVRYYVSLLMARKHIGLSLRESFLSATGSELSNESLLSQLQRRVGDRGVVLATKGVKDHEKRNYSADEDLVVSAVTYAIVTGIETSILTRDRDPLEQFRKLVYLLGTHYRSLLVAESFVDSPENVIELRSPATTPPGTTDCFEGTDRCILHLPRRFVDWVVPKVAERVGIRCHRFAGHETNLKTATLSYSAQRQMLKLLQTKGRTGGRNYDFPDGRNCHLTISPPFSSEMDGKAIIGRDRTISFGPFNGPILDVEYALQEVQRFRQQVVDMSVREPAGGSPGAKLADFYLSKRLNFAFEPGWQSLEWSELSKAIRFFDNAALFFLDRDVIQGLAKCARQSLISRCFAWSTSIRDSTIVDGLTPDEQKALKRSHAVDLRRNAPWEDGFGDYLALLTLRKQLAKVIRSRVEADFGRECTVEEMTAIARHYGGVGGERLAQQCELNWEDPLLFAGDELLVYGAICGVLQGTSVVFLTRDPLFMDQFAKLGKLLTGDYLACQFGRRQIDDSKTLPQFVSEATDPLGLGQAYVRPLHRGWHEQLLPNSPFLVNLHCWLLGRDDGESVRFSAMTYCAERGMHHLFRIKGVTGGRNVEGLNGRNLRANMVSEEEAVVTIWQDRLIHLGARDYPADDRLDLRVPSLAAADISRAHSTEAFDLPWYEPDSSASGAAQPTVSPAMTRPENLDNQGEANG